VDYTEIINSILILTVIIFIGFIVTKLKIITEEGSAVISGIIMKVSFPLLIVISMQKSFTPELFKNSMGLILLSLAIYAVLIVIVTIFGKKSSLPIDKLKILQFLMIFGNVSFMGFPVVSAIYKDVGIFYASCFNLFYNFLMFSYGIMILDRKSAKLDIKKIFNPGLIATIIGFVLFLTSYNLPYIIYRPMEWIGDMTIPLALLVVGSCLARIKLKDLINEPIIWIYTLERLLVFPIILLIILKAIGLTSYLLVIPVVLLATPAPLTAGIFAKTYGGDELLANKSIVLSNFLSIITVPLIIFLIGK
jgi:predicted permease